MTKLTQNYLEKGAEVLKERGYSVPSIDEKAIISGVQELGDKLGIVRRGDSIRHIIDLLHSRFCDVPDTPRQTSGVHILDYGTPVGVWSQGNLSVGFFIAGYTGTPGTPPLSQATVAGDVVNVFNQYQAAQPFFNFTYLAPNQAGNITIVFGTGGSVPANGGSTLPPPNGTITLSATIANGSFLPVLLHEAGHALGLSHSTNPASVMYPFIAGAVALDPETIEAIQSLYGWKAQTQLSDRASTHGPSIAVVSFPSLFGPVPQTAFMAWKGTGDDSTLWWASSSDGINWSPQQQLSDRGSSEGPCLATYHPPSPDGTPVEGLFMAWKGVSDDHNIYWSTNPDLSGWSSQQSIPVGTSARPALIEFNGQMVLAWKGVPGDSGIYWSKFDGVGTWSPQQQIAGRGTSDGPVLAVFGGQLHMFWKGIDGDDTVWHAVLVDPGNGIWGPQQQVTFTSTGNLSSGETPIAIGTSTSFSATVRGSELVLLWKGVPGDHAIWFSRFNGSTFSGQMSIPNVGTESYPAVATLNGKLIAAWRGIGDDHNLWDSSLG